MIRFIRRFIACLLGIASPSRVFLILCGGAKDPETWLDRWERKHDMRVASAFLHDPPPPIPPIWYWN